MLADQPVITFVATAQPDTAQHFYTDTLGIWTTPDGSQVAWFTDPNANTLSLTQFAPA